ncbi:hypothetical protein M405DRAFT_378625 [Rhizopogon salebrosus TDB-379]|nr:hypothetical protein M405DRAFT_378625 [Rhizopogon salebrosus TDB-379]
MFVRISTVSAIFLLLSQASVMASPVSTESTDCSGNGVARCCAEDSEQSGGVDCEKCESYSDNCASGYIASCCYTTVLDYYFCEKSD